MLSRLLGIVCILLARESVTASELAERYEVSVRTIYRDVEALSMAGIPVYTRKGKNGGISLTENFVLNRMMLTKAEQSVIMAALSSMKETGAGEEQKTLDKLCGLFKTESSNWLSIDFSDWSGRRQELFGLIKNAVLTYRLLAFDYYGQNREMSRRTVEPVQLFFKDYTWYLRAWCRQRRAMRLFKIIRMKRVECLEETFVPDAGKYAERLEETEQPAQEQPLEEIVLRIEETETWRIYDRFEEDEVTQEADGSYLVRMYAFADEWLYSMILSFGDSVRVLSPPHVKEEIRRRLLHMLERL